MENTEDEGDLAIISHERELLVTLQGSDFAWLRSIREAVERIDNGSYGECVSCGEDINESSLDALPWVSFCIRCQEQTELDRADLASSGGIGGSGTFRILVAYWAADGRRMDKRSTGLRSLATFRRKNDVLDRLPSLN